MSHWKIIESANNANIDTFSLWGYQPYFDNFVAEGAVYEVEYFKGNAKEMFKFLTEINQFTEKYKH